MYRLHQPWGIFKIWDGNAWSRDALSREHKLPACIFVVIQSNGGKRKRRESMMGSPEGCPGNEIRP